MGSKELLRRLSDGHLANVAFADARRFAEDLGFELRRQGGSHLMYKHPDIPDLLNLQSAAGAAKAYQLRQLVQLAEEYHLTVEDRR